MSPSVATQEKTSAPSFFQYCKNELADLFFPLFCLGCEAYGAWLCPRCLLSLPQRIDQRCPLCLKQLTPHGERCFGCQDRSGLDGVFAASYYHSPLLSYTIHTYKYRFMPALSETLGEFLVRSLQSTDLPLPDIIIPVPLHPRRLRFRGFNQAVLLGQYLSEHLVLGYPLSFQEILIRRRITKPQMKTRSREERLANLENAFALAPGKKGEVRGRSVWLIDDVSTTGTTLTECARALKKSGAKSVFGIVLAR
jgi:competence protein ComFC